MIASKRAWLAAIFAVYTGVVHAQSFPSQSIRFVVPWPAGGATDAIARLIAKSLSEQLGQSVFVDNKSGAGGNIGTQEFVRSKPDGHTIIMATSSTNAANPHLYAKLGFDFAPIVFIASVPNVLVVPASSPANTAAELISQAKANPGKLTYGSGGVGSSQHLAGAMFKSIAKIDIVHVPYKGSAPAVTDLMAGHVSLMLDTASLPHIKGGKLNALAVASKSRISALPNVPTFDELGISGMYAAAWYGVMAPAGTPKAVLDRLNTEINKALGSSEVRSRLTDFGAAEIGGGSPEEFARFSRSEIDRYAEIVRLSGAKLE